MNEMQVFTNEQFGQVRTLLIEGEPWFVAVDVCKALALSNPTVAVSRLDDDERAKFNLGRQGEGTIVSESGLYSLVLSSRKSEAKQFKRWITHEVIPSIRKHGAYMTEPLLNQVAENPEVILALAKQLITERSEKEILQEQLSAAQPKVAYFDAFIHAEDCTNIRNTAKELDIPQNEFVEMLLTHRIMFHDPTHRQLLPYREYQVRGYFTVRDVYTKSGMLVQQTRFTCKGKEYIRKKIKKWKEEN